MSQNNSGLESAQDRLIKFIRENELSVSPSLQSDMKEFSKDVLQYSGATTVVRSTTGKPTDTMGWDASADLSDIKSKSERDVIKSAFKAEADRLDNADGLLRSGGLDCSECGRMLELAIHNADSVYRPFWTPEEVQTYYQIADWSFEVSYAELWAKQSAKAFLKVCAEFDLGIKFFY